MKKYVVYAKESLFVLALFMVFACFGYVFARPVSAAAVTGFNPGRIMDDAVFTKKNSMSAAQIQSFLNSKVPTCDTNGTQTSEYGGGTRAQYGRSKGYAPPYTCLRNYSQGGKSAARIIYDTAQEFSINPQVLIVLLQKEQGLVTDTWPWSIQYRSATGYGCPDTAACDSTYYGFTNQVRWSARMFRAILNQSPTWYTPYELGNNRIYWNPDTGRCGSSTVNIQNLTTVALYSYTPYRPNQSALNAGYGTGDSCGSYGNRNFYQYFKDWFGSTIAECTSSDLPEKYVYRSYRPYKHFFSTRTCEKDLLSYVHGYKYEGVAFYQAQEGMPDRIPVYRVYDTKSGYHFWTQNINERNRLTTRYGWRDEGVGFYAYSKNGVDRKPVYRLYHSRLRAHLYTSSQSEITTAGKHGYQYEGVAYYASGAY